MLNIIWGWFRMLCLKLALQRYLAQTIAGNAPLTVATMKFISTQVMKADPSMRDLKRCDNMVASCLAWKTT